MPITDSAYPLLMQIPLAGIVVLVVAVFLWFLMILIREERKSRSEDNQAMRDFLKDQREQSNGAISRIAEEVKLLAQEISKLNGVMLSHDAASKARNEART